MRIIFLDVDGVLNKALVYSNSPESDVIKGKYGWMNKSLVENLNRLTDETEAKIVVSSAWRHNKFEDTKEEIESYGITGEIIGQTPRIDDRSSVRGNEIKAWIQQNKELLGVDYWNFKQYVILDDDSDMLLEQAQHFVNTDPFAGLSERMMFRAKGKLQLFGNDDLDATETE